MNHNPIPVSDETRDAMRHCIWSSIHGGSRNLLPDYFCRHSRVLCGLYLDPACSRYEQFPERFDT